ncbi:uncharacterized protein LOC135349782 [Halichondria panicea]|uniref:uncharacterized protein LOC135349782 n=1 Tax=Halichondria panicea TaxID=6063 RepID=UPI00312B71CA
MTPPLILDIRTYVHTCTVPGRSKTPAYFGILTTGPYICAPRLGPVPLPQPLLPHLHSLAESTDVRHMGCNDKRGDKKIMARNGFQVKAWMWTDCSQSQEDSKTGMG